MKIAPMPKEFPLLKGEEIVCPCTLILMAPGGGGAQCNAMLFAMNSEYKRMRVITESESDANLRVPVHNLYSFCN